MAKINKISVRINGSDYSIKANHEVTADSVLILPLRGFVGAEHYGATRNVTIDTIYATENSLRQRGIDI